MVIGTFVVFTFILKTPSTFGQFGKEKAVGVVNSQIIFNEYCVYL